MPTAAWKSVRVIDSHTAGEPTRLVIDGGPDLGRGPLAERREVLGRQFDDFRSLVINEPRGSEVLVGALLCPPVDPACAAGVIFFNNVGYLGMCGHGTIGLIVSLAHLGRLGPGRHRVETPVGEVQTVLHPSGEVSVENVASYRLRTGVELAVPGYGKVKGDIAWGGNWFFLVTERTHTVAVDLAWANELTAYTRAIRRALDAAGITGAEGAAIDHIEIYGPPRDAAMADSKNFVLCPGGAYDRSPCGTGTSAKLACLHADGKLRAGQVWRQAGILDTVFEARFNNKEAHPDDAIFPTITGCAWVTAASELLIDPNDPLRSGIATPALALGA